VIIIPDDAIRKDDKRYGTIPLNFLDDDDDDDDFANTDVPIPVPDTNGRTKFNDFIDRTIEDGFLNDVTRLCIKRKQVVTKTQAILNNMLKE